MPVFPSRQWRILKITHFPDISTHYAPSQDLTHIFLFIPHNHTSWGYLPHFASEANEAQRGDVPCTPGYMRQEVALSEFMLRAFVSNHDAIRPLFIATLCHHKMLCDSCQTNRLRRDEYLSWIDPSNSKADTQLLPSPTGNSSAASSHTTSPCVPWTNPALSHVQDFASVHPEAPFLLLYLPTSHQSSRPVQLLCLPGLSMRPSRKDKMLLP